MQLIKAGLQQSVFDIALQYHGTVNTVFDIANYNDIGLDTILTDGQELYIEEIDNVDVQDKNINVVTYYSRNGIKPATGVSAGSTTGTGIGYWTVGLDYEVY